jgi:heat shock protein HtpX
MAEGLWRSVSGVRGIATREEINRLLPLFKEVYREARQTDPNLNNEIALYIQEDMDVNAFAFGRGTLVLTRGSIELLSDDCLKGLIAHEFGHFSHFDTVVLLFSAVGNIFLSIVMKIIKAITKILLFMVRNKDTTFTVVFKLLHTLVIGTYKAVLFVGDMILMSVSREHEFMADEFASRCGYGGALIDVLYQIHTVSIQKPGSIIEQLRSTHPPLTERIRALEKLNHHATGARERNRTQETKTTTFIEKASAGSKKNNTKNPLFNMFFEYVPPRLAVNEVFSLADADEHFRVLEEIIFKDKTYLYIVRLDNNMRFTDYYAIVEKTIKDNRVSVRKVTDYNLCRCLIDVMKD